MSFYYADTALATPLPAVIADHIVRSHDGPSRIVTVERIERLSQPDAWMVFTIVQRTVAGYSAVERRVSYYNADGMCRWDMIAD